MFKKLMFTGAALAVSAIAQAVPMEYDITVSSPIVGSNGWFNTNGNPYGMALSPTLSGSITADSETNSITDFSLTTGSKTWTLADNPTFIDLYFRNGVLSQFSMRDFIDAATGGYMYIYSNNTMAVSAVPNPWAGNGGAYNACNYCVSVGEGRLVTAEVPEPSSVALLGLGLLGFAAARRKKSNLI